jgi:uncharacterized SAM-binding protein YcdF (DUF218 family)
VKRTLGKFGRLVVRLAAAAFILQILGGLLGLPEPLVCWFTGRNDSIRVPPHYIVVLGGAGIPSEAGLIRTYYAAEYGLSLTNAAFVVALPADEDPEVSSVGRMRDELVMRGISEGRIRMETRGLNTHQQAANVARMLGPEALNEAVLVVTSPSHMRRALLCFRKAGFRQVGALPAENTDNEADPGPHTRQRYSFWSTLQFEVQIARELTAMVVYKLRGWI